MAFAIIEESALSDKELSDADVRTLAAASTFMSRGEGKVTVPALASRSGRKVNEARESLSRLVAHGYIRETGAATYTLSVPLRKEAPKVEVSDMVVAVPEARAIMAKFEKACLGDATKIAKATFWGAKYNSDSAVSLVRQFGENSVIGMIDSLSAGYASFDQFAPTFKSLRDLELRWHKAVAWKKRNDEGKSNKIVSG
ncbi:MAG: hypothetical protein WC455_10140 [Dehalococcoidia bacterium]|jgi:hypothetical protein